MAPRIDYTKVAPGALRAMYGLEKYLAESTIEQPLRELVKMRASQINGCAYCIDMHSKDARSAGEREQRLYGLSAWREAPYYNERERAALEWTEALTLIAGNHVPDELYERACRQFSEQELVDLTLAVVTINAWNRSAISFPPRPGRTERHRVGESNDWFSTTVGVNPQTVRPLKRQAVSESTFRLVPIDRHRFFVTAPNSHHRSD